MEKKLAGNWRDNASFLATLVRQVKGQPKEWHERAMMFLEQHEQLKRQEAERNPTICESKK